MLTWRSRSQVSGELGDCSPRGGFGRVDPRRTRRQWPRSKPSRDVARVGPRQRAAVFGASGGVGSYPVQIAKTAGATVTESRVARRPSSSGRSGGRGPRLRKQRAGRDPRAVRRHPLCRRNRLSRACGRDDRADRQVGARHVGRLGARPPRPCDTDHELHIVWHLRAAVLPRTALLHGVYAQPSPIAVEKDAQRWVNAIGGDEWRW